MRLNVSHLVDSLLQTDIKPNDLILYFDVITKLHKIYGRSLYTTKILDVINTTDSTVYSLLQILIHYKIHKASDIKYIGKYIQQKSKDYIPTFTIHIPKEQYKDTLEKNLKKTFPNSQIHMKSNIDLGLSISGEGRQYKRNLDQDIEKILG